MYSNRHVTINHKRNMESQPSVIIHHERNMDAVSRYTPALKYAWASFDAVELPYVIRREGISLLAVRLIEKYILCHFPSVYPQEIACKPPLQSQLLSKPEADLLTQLCRDGLNAPETILPGEPAVYVEEFKRFFMVVKGAYPNIRISYKKPITSPHVDVGWILVKDSMVPYVVRWKSCLLPLNVLRGAPEVLVNVHVDTTAASQAEVKALNQLCSQAGLVFAFQVGVELVDLCDLVALCPDCHIEEMDKQDLLHVSKPTHPFRSDNMVIPTNVQTESNVKIKNQLLQEEQQNLFKCHDMMQKYIDKREKLMMDDQNYMQMLRIQEHLKNYEKLQRDLSAKQQISKEENTVVENKKLPEKSSHIRAETLRVDEPLAKHEKPDDDRQPPPLIPLNDIAIMKSPFPVLREQTPATLPLYTAKPPNNMPTPTTLPLYTAKPPNNMPSPSNIHGQVVNSPDKPSETLIIRGGVQPQLPGMITSNTYNLHASNGYHMQYNYQEKKNDKSIEILPMECFGKTICCIMRGKLKAKYALVEAVVRVFFPHCDLGKFVRFLEYELSIILYTLKRHEEEAFIEFYGIEAPELRCNLIIKLKDFLHRVSWIQQHFGNMDISPEFADQAGMSALQLHDQALLPKMKGDATTTENGNGKMGGKTINLDDEAFSDYSEARYMKSRASLEDTINRLHANSQISTTERIDCNSDGKTAERIDCNSEGKNATSDDKNWKGLKRPYHKNRKRKSLTD